MSRTHAKNPPSGGPLLERVDPEIPWAILPSALPTLAQLARQPLTVSPEVAEAHMNAQASRDEQPIAGAVAVIRLRGLLTPRPSLFSIIFGGGSGLQGFREALDEAVSNDDIASIVIDVDSPGGSTDLIAETAADVLAARGTKPIVAVANTLAASGAYWIASQADEVVQTPSGFVGSIGVFLVHQDCSGLNEQIGILPTYISAGKYKTDGNFDEPLSDTARETFQERVDEMYGMFVAGVAAGRGVSPKDVTDGYGEGRVLPSRLALEAGMVDRVASFEEVITGLVRANAPNGALTGSQATQLAELVAARQNETLQAKLALPTPPAPAAQEPAPAEEPDPASAEPPAVREDATPAATPAWQLPTPRRH